MKRAKLLQTNKIIPQQIYARKILDVFDPLIMSLYNVAFHSFVTLSANMICVWDANGGVMLRAYDKSKIFPEDLTARDFTTFCLSKSGRKIIVATDGGEITVINFLTGAVMKKLDPHNGPVTWLGFSVTEKCVLSTGMDGRLHIVDEVDTEGFVAGKKLNSGSKQSNRSVLLKSIEIKTRDNAAGLQSNNHGGSTSPANITTTTATDTVTYTDTLTTGTTNVSEQRKKSRRMSALSAIQMSRGG